jgi:hypothetical protein
MSPKFLKIAPLLLIVQAALAEDRPAPASAAASTAQPTSVASSTPMPRYELKRKSEFTLENRGRPPFWPIGWVRQGPAPLVAAKQVQIGDDMFRVTSILVGNPSMAVINGRSYEEGQFIRMPKGSSPQLRPKLYRIGDGQVLIQVQNQLLPVQLRRQELNEVKRDAELLNEEKDDPLPLPNVSVKSASAR